MIDTIEIIALVSTGLVLLGNIIKLIRDKACKCICLFSNEENEEKVMDLPK